MIRSIILAALLTPIVACSTSPRSSYSSPREVDRSPLRAEQLTIRAAELIEEDPEQAERLLREALVADLFHGPAHNDLGVGLMEIGATVADEGNFEAARREFQASIDADPEFAAPLFNMAILLMREGMDAAAREYAARYAVLDPDSGWAAELEELEVSSP